MKFYKWMMLAGIACITACGSPVDEQYQNRQIAYVDIVPGPKANPTQVAMFKQALQPLLIGKLQGKGQPPALGMTVTVYGLELPEDPYGGILFSDGRVSGAVIAGVKLWDVTSRTVLEDFDVSSSVSFRRETMLGSMFGHPSGNEPESINIYNVYDKMAQNIAQNTSIYLYGVK